MVLDLQVFGTVLSRYWIEFALNCRFWWLFGIQNKKTTKNRQKEIRQIKMTLKHETVKLRPRYWINAVARSFFAFTSEVIKRKRIYWFGTFPWNKCEKQFSQNLAHKNANQFNEANFYDIRLIACAMVLHSVSCFFFVFFALCQVSCCYIVTAAKYLEVEHCFYVSRSFIRTSLKTMLMSYRNILYELFWHLIFAKNMTK